MTSKEKSDIIMTLARAFDALVELAKNGVTSALLKFDEVLAFAVSLVDRVFSRIDEMEDPNIQAIFASLVRGAMQSVKENVAATTA